MVPPTPQGLGYGLPGGPFICFALPCHPERSAAESKDLAPGARLDPARFFVGQQSLERRALSARRDAPQNDSPRARSPRPSPLPSRRLRETRAATPPPEGEASAGCRGRQPLRRGPAFFRRGDLWSLAQKRPCPTSGLPRTPAPTALTQKNRPPGRESDFLYVGSSIT